MQITILIGMLLTFIAELTPASSASLADRTICAEQAEKFYQDYMAGSEVAHASFQNHIDDKRNKCYVAISSMSKDYTFFHGVYDAIENTEVAIYIWKSDEVKKYWEVPPQICKVKNADDKIVSCSNSDEFGELVKSFYGLDLGTLEGQ